MHRISLFTCAFALALASHVEAQSPSCSELGGNILYGVGGSAQTPLIGQIASRLRDPADAAHQLTIVYAEPGACYAFTVFDSSKTEAERAIAQLPNATTAKYWNQGNATAQRCVLDEAELADFSVSPLDSSLCPEPVARPDDLGDFEGPIGTYNVIVPTASSETVISAEAIYFLLELGDGAQVEPWTDERYISRRGWASSIMQAFAKAVGFSGDFEHGYETSQSTVAASGVHSASPGVDAVTVPNSNATLGFASGENAEANRGTIRTLAYQHIGQTCGYWPDSSATASDKLNVRTGRYALWSALHFYAPTDEDDAIVDADVAKLIGYATGTLAPPPELPILDLYIDGFAIPGCAMQVRREEDLGALASYQPDEPCGCYFEARSSGRSNCVECEDADDCPSDTPTCRLGYCEAR